MDSFADGRHAAFDVEEWVFAAWTADGLVGTITGHRIMGRRAWYWAAVAGAGRPLLHVTDFDVPVRADPFVVKGEALWAEHVCEAPMEQWSIGNETYASALDEPDDALGRAYGQRTPIAFDLEWYATALPVDLDAPDAFGYEQPGVVHGRIDIKDQPAIEFEEAPARRWHRWSADRFGPLALPETVAHTGVRAPFSFPDGSISDLVLSSRGWGRRVPRRRLG